MAQAHPQTVLQNTLQAFSQTEDSEVPANGTDLVKEWMSVLKHTDGTEAIHAKLTDLYDELLNPSPDSQRVKECLNTLAGQMQAMARATESETAEQVAQLADTLRAFATDLGRINDDDQLAQNEPDPTPVYANPGDHLQVLLTSTQETLAGGLSAVTPEQGVSMLQEWMSVVQAEPSAQWLEAPLRELTDALAKGDMRSTERLMRELAGTAQEYANNNDNGPFTTGLTNLATALIQFAGPLS